MIVWLTQALQRVEILIEHGQGLGVFLYLSILIIPSLLGIVIPFALFGATVYAVHRLHSDSEIAVMFASGVSGKRVAAPILFITALGAAATFYINVDLMPRSYRIMKQKVAEIRAEFASAILRSGEFTRVLDGFTIYVEEVRSGGQFVGLLINDHRNPDQPETYMAERGLLRETDAGPVLYLARGNVQHVSAEADAVDFIRFEETAINVSSFNDRTADFQMELTERYPSELFNPDMDNPWDRMNAGKLVAEGHNRLSSPLYAFAFVLIGLYFLLGGAYNRRGYLLRIAVASGFVVALRVAGFVIQGLVATTGAFWMLYAAPSVAIIVFAFLLSDSSGIFSPARPASSPVGEKS